MFSFQQQVYNLKTPRNDKLQKREKDFHWSFQAELLFKKTIINQEHKPMPNTVIKNCSLRQFFLKSSKTD